MNNNKKKCLQSAVQAGTQFCFGLAVVTKTMAYM